jgi:hypothetical protein
MPSVLQVLVSRSFARLKHFCMEFLHSSPMNFPATSRMLTAKAKAIAEREAADAAVFHFRAKDVPDRIRESKSIDFEAEEREREAERARRIKEAAVSKCAAAALPPRMQARAQQEKEGGGGHKAVAAEHSFAPEINSVVPDFASRHARSQAQLEAVKAKLAAEKKAIVIKAFELRSDRVYWSKIAQFEGFYAGASVEEGVTAALGALGLEAGCSQWALLCALRSKVGGREFLMREVFEEYCVMPPGNLQVLADAERDKVSRGSRVSQRAILLPCTAALRPTIHPRSGHRQGDALAVLRAQRGAPRADVGHHAACGQRRRGSPPPAR